MSTFQRTSGFRVHFSYEKFLLSFLSVWQVANFNRAHYFFVELRSASCGACQSNQEMGVEQGEYTVNKSNTLLAGGVEVGQANQLLSPPVTRG